MELVKIVQQNGETHMLFSAVLGVAHTRALHTQLDQVLTQATPLVLDAGQVVQVDAAAMQVLAGFCRQRRAQGAAMHWRAVSAPVQQACQLLGLDSLLEDIT